MTAIRTFKNSPIILSDTQVKAVNKLETKQKTVIKEVAAPSVPAHEECEEGQIHYIDNEAIAL